MRKANVMVAMGLMVAACSDADGGEFLNTGGTSGAGSPGAIEQGGSNDPAAGGNGMVDGVAVFGLQCATCHGPQGLGTVLAPNIQHPVRDYYTWVIRNGRMGHPEYPTLPMAAYDTTALPDPALNEILDFLAAEPQPTSGEGLYQDYCSNCHGADGAGGVTGQGIAGEDLSAFITTVRSGENSADFASEPRSGFMPGWTADQLSDAEITLIRDYVLSL